MNWGLLLGLLFSLAVWAGIYAVTGWRGCAVAFLLGIGTIVYASGKEAENGEDN